MIKKTAFLFCALATMTFVGMGCGQDTGTPIPGNGSSNPTSSTSLTQQLTGQESFSANSDDLQKMDECMPDKNSRFLRRLLPRSWDGTVDLPDSLQIPGQVSLSWTDGNFTLFHDGDRVVGGTWKELDDDTAEVHVGGVTLIVDVKIDGDQVQLKLAENEHNKALCGEVKKFRASKMKLTVKSDGLSNGEFVTEVSEDKIDGEVEFSIKNGNATLNVDEFPSFDVIESSIPLPGHKLHISLKDSGAGVFDGTSLSFPTATFTGSGVIDVEGSLTTSSLSVSNQSGISVTGSPLADGKMKLVFAGKIPDSIPSEALKGGVVAIELELQEAQ